MKSKGNSFKTDRKCCLLFFSPVHNLEFAVQEIVKAVISYSILEKNLTKNIIL